MSGTEIKNKWMPKHHALHLSEGLVDELASICNLCRAVKLGSQYGVTPDTIIRADSLQGLGHNVEAVDRIAAFIGELSDSERAGVMAYVKAKAAESDARMQKVKEEPAAAGIDLDALFAEDAARTDKIGFSPEFIERNNRAVEARIEELSKK